MSAAIKEPRSCKAPDKIGLKAWSRELVAIGTVPNLAARRCGETKPGEILVPQRLLGTGEELVAAESAGELTLQVFIGSSRPTIYSALRLDLTRAYSCQSPKSKARNPTNCRA